MQLRPVSIAKLGVHVLTRSYAQLLMPKGITVEHDFPGLSRKQCWPPTPATASRTSGEF